jgi:hypothetical protein
MVVDVKRYGLKDKASEKKFGFSLTKSVEASIQLKASGHGLCEELIVYSTKKVIPNREDLAEILKAANGKVSFLHVFI